VDEDIQKMHSLRMSVIVHVFNLSCLLLLMVRVKALRLRRTAGNVQMMVLDAKYIYSMALQTHMTVVWTGGILGMRQNATVVI